MIVTTVLEQKKVYAAARKLGGYRELVAYAMQQKEKRNGIL